MKTRLITFRVSEEEFQRLKSMREAYRALDDFKVQEPTISVIVRDALSQFGNFLGVSS